MTDIIKTVDGSVSFQELIQGLHGIFSSDRVNVDEVQDLLKGYKSNENDWKQFAMFDTHRYTRNLVDVGNGKFNLMLLCWGEGMGSSIHDHADAHCFVKMLDGQLKETLYHWPDTEGDPMQEKAVNVYGRDGVTYINDSMGLHRVENASHTDPAVSLHLYSPPFGSCSTFDERTGHKRQVHVTFWSEFGQRTPFKVPSSCLIPCDNKVATVV